MLNDEWMTGFFEGEGCFTWGKSKQRYSPKVLIAQNEKEILEKIKAHLGFGFVSFNGKNCYRWNCGGFTSCRKFILRVQPHLKTLTKKKQLMRFLFVFPTLMDASNGYGHNCEAKGVEERIKKWKALS